MSSPQVIDATFTPCHGFGGGWIVPKSPPALRALVEYYGDEPAELAPIGACGFIVEPADVADVAGYLNRRNLVTEVN
jgi:hypothetical protein